MNLQYLKAFYVTVKANSISKAAKILHLTQPGLSMQIQSLENELQVSLLNRSNKGVQLTESGKVVFDYAVTILSLQDNIERDLKNLKSENKQLLIGSCKVIGEHALPCSLYVYKHKNKDVNINMKISSCDEVINSLINRNINIGILNGFTDNKNIKVEKITKCNLLLVTSLAAVKDSITLTELLKLPLIFREKGSGTREAILFELIKHNIKFEDLNIIYELNSMEAIKNSVLAGNGISYIPQITIEKELKEGSLKVINVEGLNLTTEFYIGYRKDYELNSYEQDFINLIKSTERGFC